MENTPISIAVCNQKGGVGKSTFTVLLASHLHYTLQRDVLVVDCDYPQWSIYTQRSRELEIKFIGSYFEMRNINVSSFCNKGKYWDVKLLQQTSDPTTKNQPQHTDI